MSGMSGDDDEQPASNRAERGAVSGLNMKQKGGEDRT